MQHIVPHLWFDTQAVEASQFYTQVFGDTSRVIQTSVIKDTPSGDCDVVSFELWGYEFQAISAGPLFQKNPSISFMVNFDPSQDTRARERIDEMWQALSDGGTILMPLQSYPFSEQYGWIQDKYGVSWQLILTKPEGEARPRIMPSLLFVGDVCGKAEEATDYYISIFDGSARGAIARYTGDPGPDKAGTVMFTDFTLKDQWFVAMDSAQNHTFSFNEGISLIIYCDSQADIDYYTEKLSAVPASEQCGWVKDAYGISWQIVPRGMDAMLSTDDADARARVTHAFLQMKKIDIATLERAFAGTT